MNMDVVDLRDFYATALGQVAARALRRKIRLIWPDLRDMDVLGVGYPVPYLNPLRNDGARVMVAMPSRQGVLHWPAEGGVTTVLADEWELPFPDLSVDRVLIVHGLETTERIRPMLREAWRVLKGSGRLLIVAPNRRGLWARFERTPFGHGQPFSPRQISRLLRDNLFTPRADPPRGVRAADPLADDSGLGARVGAGRPSRVPPFFRGRAGRGDQADLCRAHRFGSQTPLSTGDARRLMPDRENGLRLGKIAAAREDRGRGGS